MSLALVLGPSGNHDHRSYGDDGFLLLLYASAHSESECGIYVRYFLLLEYLLWYSLCLYA